MKLGAAQRGLPWLTALTVWLGLAGYNKAYARLAVWPAVTGWPTDPRLITSGPSLGRPMSTNADRRHPRVTAPTLLRPGLPESICDTGTAMPKPGELS